MFKASTNPFAKRTAPATTTTPAPPAETKKADDGLFFPGKMRPQTNTKAPEVAAKAPEVGKESVRKSSSNISDTYENDFEEYDVEISGRPSIKSKGGASKKVKSESIKDEEISMESGF